MCSKMSLAQWVIVSFSLLQQGIQFSHYRSKAAIFPQETCVQVYFENGMILLLSVYFWVSKALVSVSDS